MFIANTKRRNNRGEHWVAFFVKSPEHVEYFDSFGDWPPGGKEFVDYLSAFKHAKFNRDKLQAPYEISCGPHTIYFLMKRCQGESFESIVKSLTHPLGDVRVKMYIYELLKK